MKKINYYLMIFISALMLGSCAEEIPGSEVLVSFPAVNLNGPALLTLGVDDTYADPGVIATFGPEDISDQIEITGLVDTSTPGIYRLDYTAKVDNEIGEESSSSATRLVLVAGDIDAVNSVDLSGTWVGAGWASSPAPQQIIQLAPGWYQIGDILSSGNGIQANFAFTGEEIIMPNQPGPFGNVNTTGEGTGAVYNSPTSFEWTVFVGCCGNFGPVVWTKQ